MKRLLFTLVILCQLVSIPCTAESANKNGFPRSEEQQAGTITISNTTSYTGSIIISDNINIIAGGTLTISGTATMNDDTIIRVYNGGKLIVDGGVLQNAYVVFYSGSVLTIDNDGVLSMRNGVDLTIPAGVVVNMNSGTVN